MIQMNCVSLSLLLRKDRWKEERREGRSKSGRREGERE